MRRRRGPATHPHFGRVYAACGGIFVVMALTTWGVLIEGFGPERWDILGASVALLGSPIMVAAPHA